MDVKIYEGATWLCPVSEETETHNFSSVATSALPVISDQKGGAKLFLNYFDTGNLNTGVIYGTKSPDLVLTGF